LKIDIYTSTKSGDKYLSVQAGVKLEALEILDTLDPDMLILSPFRTRLEIDTSKPHKALNAKDIVKQIELNGFALHGAKTVIKLSAKKKTKVPSKKGKPKTATKTIKKPAIKVASKKDPGKPKKVPSTEVARASRASKAK